MSVSDVDTIILVSDGLPWLRTEMREKGVMDPDKIIEAVKGWNKRHKIVIHTVGIHRAKEGGGGGGGGRGTKFLQRLAEENGGKYVGK